MVVLIHLWFDGLQSVDLDWWRCFSQELFLRDDDTSGSSITTEVYTKQVYDQFCPFPSGSNAPMLHPFLHLWSSFLGLGLFLGSSSFLGLSLFLGSLYFWGAFIFGVIFIFLVVFGSSLFFGLSLFLGFSSLIVQCLPTLISISLDIAISQSITDKQTHRQQWL